MLKEEFMKMKKLYHYTKFDTAIKILESHSLRFGRLHDIPSFASFCTKKSRSAA